MNTTSQTATPMKSRVEGLINQAHQQQKSVSLNAVKKAEQLVAVNTDRFYARALVLNDLVWSKVDKAAEFVRKGDRDEFAPVGTAD